MNVLDFRSGPEEVDEREIFKGSENPITMSQKYTHEFQCPFDLTKYPFDRQVHQTHNLI